MAQRMVAIEGERNRVFIHHLAQPLAYYGRQCNTLKGDNGLLLDLYDFNCSRGDEYTNFRMMPVLYKKLIFNFIHKIAKTTA